MMWRQRQQVILLLLLIINIIIIKSYSMRKTNNQMTLSGSRSSVIWPVMMTALSREYTRPSTNLLRLSSVALTKACTTSSNCFTGRYSKRTYFFAGIMWISAATRKPSVPWDHGIVWNRSLFSLYKQYVTVNVSFQAQLKKMWKTR